MLNPELRRLATPAGRTYSVKVPVGQGAATRRCLDDVPADRLVTFRTHTVRKGQTLSALARMYGSKPQDIAAANGLGSKTLARGTELIIPVPPRAAVKTASAMKTAAATTTTTTPGAPRATNARVRVAYTVKTGDTLTRIAARYRTTVRDILSWNKGVRPTQLAAGDTLTVYTRHQD
jgi:membrane-bound lytic murein transglycosylase D